jgi:hypothetical protein
VRALNTAIYSRLAGDPTLQALAPGGVHLGAIDPSTDQDGAEPIGAPVSVEPSEGEGAERHADAAVFQVMPSGEGPSYTFTQMAAEELRILVKGVARDGAAEGAAWDRADSIRARCASLLQDQGAALALGDGRRVLSIRRVGSPVEYFETEAGVRTWHAGYTFRVVVS